MLKPRDSLGWSSVLRQLGAACWLWSICAASLLGQTAADGEPSIPSVQQVETLLAEQPLSVENWPEWRARLLAWMSERSRNPQAAYGAARHFMLQQADENGELPEALSTDFFAQYLLGSTLLYDGDAVDFKVRAILAQKPLRRSLALREDFARTHRDLALALLFEEPGSAEAGQHLRRVRELDADLPVAWVEAQAAMLQENYALAAEKFRRALEDEPDQSSHALGLAQALLVDAAGRQQPQGAGVAQEIAALQQRFPDEGTLACFHAVALAGAGDYAAAAEQLDRARQLGADPVEILGADSVSAIERMAAPGLLQMGMYLAIGFVAVYAVVIAGMALTGLALGRFTRGVHAVELLGRETPMVEVGQVVRTQGESTLARLYGLALMGGLIMFYLAIPFVVLGLTGATLGLLYAIFLLPRVPVKLLVIVAVVGLGMAWSVLKSLFAKAGSGGFGLPLDRRSEPKLHETIDQVARAVDTPPVQAIYLAPGSEIGVHQEGRGPFGMFGVKSRVLTLGLASLKHLTVDQLRAIMAHEYAHFSHGDTFYSRFIHQVTMSIEQSLMGMAAAGGMLNYVNPFYWFMLWYYRAYSLMAAGFSRSREFLADRMAASLYGRDVFAHGLMTVATEASLFEAGLHENVLRSLQTEHPIANLYQASSPPIADAQQPDIDQIHREILNQRGSAYASHPTIAERLEAVSVFPDASHRDDTPACQLLANQQQSEEEATQFLTAYYLQLIAYHQAQRE